MLPRWYQENTSKQLEKRCMELTIAAIIAAIVGIGAGAGGVYAYNKKNEKGGKNKADDLIRKAKHEASDIVLEAKKQATATAEKSKEEKV